MQFGSINDQNGLHASPEIRTSIKKLSKQLTKENMILGRAVGFAGEERPPYKSFQKLVEQATLDELVFLCDNKNPIIRGYSFWGLIIKNRRKAMTIKHKFVDDDQWVNTNLSGCIPVPYKIMDFIEMISNIPDEQMEAYYKN